MTVLWSYLAEIWNAMQADADLRERVEPQWENLKRLFAFVDGTKDPDGIELRQAMEKVIQQDLPLRDRGHALTVLVRPHLPGSTLH
jgi:hypothetical protein